MANKKLFNDNWEFYKEVVSEQKEAVLHDNESGILRNPIGFTKVDIPHDWMIYDTSCFYESALGWYRKSFHVDIDGDKVYALRFDGVYMDCEIFINGKLIYEWKYGYSTFEVDITNYLIQGCNQVGVKVKLNMPNSRWYSGAGIYRNVWFYERNKVHFHTDGIYISTSELEYGWKVHIETEILEEDKLYVMSNQDYIEYDIYDQENKLLYHHISMHMNTEFTLDKVIPWNMETPYLYRVESTLYIDNIEMDKQIHKIGFRTIEFHTDRGFFLNHKYVKLKGTCEHHDLGALGAAVNKVAIKKRLEILKDMGVNTIRTAHNMCAVELLELADEMGILINAESFDMWKRSKTTYDYARFFNEWVEKDVESWIKRDRNHPSIIMWCIGNEIYDTHADEEGQTTTKYLMDLVRQYDKYNHAPITIGSNFMPWENARKCADIVKLAGYNYAEKYYEEHHKEHPDWYIYGSETGSVVQSRGIYHFPLAKGILSDDDEQCSSLGNSITSWGAKSIEKCITDDRDATFSAGMYIWSGFDYIGEPTPYHTKNSYFGQIDTAGFKKDSYYIYQSAWTNYKDNPMIHIFPYWDFNDGQMIDIRICSNAPKIELFYNEVSLGITEIDHIKGKNIVANYSLPYKEGTLTAMAYDEEHQIIAVDIKESFTDPIEIMLTPDKRELIANGYDLIYVDITMRDLEGREVYNANNRVQVQVTGAGRLLGLDNGDSTDYDSYKGISRRLFSGKLSAIIGAKKEAGDIRVTVSSMGMEKKELILKAVEGEIEEGISCIEENKLQAFEVEVPVRKIKLISKNGTVLTPKLKVVEVEAILYPENCSYHDIIWKATNDSGVESNIVSITTNGKRIRLEALGDGEFYLRAMTKNGGEKIKLISMLNFTITGMGTAYYNPYELISGSLYSKTYGEVGNGNERGIATARDGESVVVYEKLDFGPIGSDIITLPIFELGGKATRIQIYEGDIKNLSTLSSMSEEEYKEHALLADVIYHKTSRWNTYQEETYQLYRKLKGITSISFVLNDKIHLKGFYFKEPKKAYEILQATMCDNIYGDSFTMLSDKIQSIGNNVTLLYEDMNFDSKVNGIRICGKSHNDKNTIRIKFTCDEMEYIENVEFPYSEEVIIQEFRLREIYGNGTIEFVFLPGSNFDFVWYQFMILN